MIVFDDVEIPWENVFFYRHTRAAAYIRATLHRYSAFPVRPAPPAARRHAARRRVRQRAADRRSRCTRACARRSPSSPATARAINAHLTAAIELGRAEPRRAADAEPVAALHRPRARVLAAAGDDAPGPRPVRRPDQPDAASAASSRTRSPASWLREVLRGSARSTPRSARKLLALARDLLNSDYAGHRLTFQLFAQSPPFSHLLAVYNNYDFERPARPGAPAPRRAPETRGSGAMERADRRRRPPARSGRSTRRTTYPEQQLVNDLCQAVVAGDTVYLRGQVRAGPGQRARTSASATRRRRPSG